MELGLPWKGEKSVPLSHSGTYARRLRVTRLEARLPLLAGDLQQVPAPSLPGVPISSSVKWGWEHAFPWAAGRLQGDLKSLCKRYYTTVDCRDDDAWG